jgi:hypothetical protein
MVTDLFFFFFFRRQQAKRCHSIFIQAATFSSKSVTIVLAYHSALRNLFKRKAEKMQPRVPSTPSVHWFYFHGRNIDLHPKPERSRPT